MNANEPEYQDGSTRMEKTCYKHICENCNYRTNKIHEWNRHLNTNKHAVNTCSDDSPLICHICDICEKKLKSRSGLYKHKKLCSSQQQHPANEVIFHQENLSSSSASSKDIVLHDPHMAHKVMQDPKLLMTMNLNEIITKDFIISILQQNQELKNLLMEEREMRKEDSEELKSMIEELAKQPTIVNHSTNTTHNTQFNLNIFLNEKCKDAITLSQFVDSLEVGPDSVEYTGVHGYVAGISKIFMDGLRQMDVYTRPIHCTDLKREILYIKENDVWEKDNPEKSKFKKALNTVVRKNMQQMRVWMNQNPRCEILDTSEYHLHLNIMRQCIGGGDLSQEDSNNRKILRNIAKEVMIDRTTM